MGAGVPIASLVGLMLVVSYSTFSWSSLQQLGRIPLTDATVIALVSIVTVYKARSRRGGGESESRCATSQ